MSSILTPGYVRWDGTKYVLDPIDSIVGPAGPAGATGAAGPAGPAGATGTAQLPPGLNGYIDMQMPNPSPGSFTLTNEQRDNLAWSFSDDENGPLISSVTILFNPPLVYREVTVFNGTAHPIAIGPSDTPKTVSNGNKVRKFGLWPNGNVQYVSGEASS